RGAAVTKSSVVAATEFWHPECGGRSIRRAQPHHPDYGTPTTPPPVGLLDGGPHGSNLQKPSSFALSADFSSALGSVVFAPGVRLPSLDVHQNETASEIRCAAPTATRCIITACGT